MSTQITVTNTRHIDSEYYRSIGGVGGYQYQPETTTVDWAGGTRLIVESYRAKACYNGTWYTMPSLGTTIHSEIVKRWSRAISQRLQRDVQTPSLTDRMRAGWTSQLPTTAA